MAEEKSVGVAVYVPNHARDVYVLHAADAVLKCLDTSSWDFISEAPSGAKGVGAITGTDETFSDGLARLVLGHECLFLVQRVNEAV